MEKPTVNILLIGLGYNSRRNYYPFLQKMQQEGQIDRILVLDLKSQSKVIDNYLFGCQAARTEVFYLDEAQNINLDRQTNKKLCELAAKNRIKGVIISTEPLAHLVYARWALENGLSVLMEKPVSIREAIIDDDNLGKQLVSDYKDLVLRYEAARQKNPGIVFAVTTQRRFHGGFAAIKEKINEVYRITDCPVTSVQSFHGDGQWRFPTEIIDQSMTPYNQGYGKCAHSGYHIFDIVSWLMEGNDNRPDTMEVVSSFSTPVDFINQYKFSDYRRDFKDYDKTNKYSESEFKARAQHFGEMDCFADFTFKKRGRVMTLASINLCHNGVSQRNWLTSEGRNLYKGIGRVRHESHYILQGPFQAIGYFSYQSQGANAQKADLFDFGGEFHGDIFIFRNSRFKPEWKCVDKLLIKDLVKINLDDANRSHQKESRIKLVRVFVENLISGDQEIVDIADLTKYARSVKMFSAVYQSIARRRKGANPLIKMKI